MEDKPTILEHALIWYARHFPISRGKIRLIDSFWPLVADKTPFRTATLVYSGFKAPCDLQDMLQRQYYFFGTYFFERNLLTLWEELASKSNLVFDVGANAGIYSLAALAANPGASVHAFEPTPEIAERLREAVRLNDLSGLHVHQMAVGACESDASLIRCRGGADNDGMNFIVIGSDDGRGEVVKVCGLDNFCAGAGIKRIDLLKIDVQGHEPNVLRGARRLLDRGAIDTIFIELNWSENPSNCPATDSVNLLTTCGYRFADPSEGLNWRKAGEWLRNLTDVIAHSPVNGAW